MQNESNAPISNIPNSTYTTYQYQAVYLSHHYQYSPYNNHIPANYNELNVLVIASPQPAIRSSIINVNINSIDNDLASSSLRARRAAVAHCILDIFCCAICIGCNFIGMSGAENLHSCRSKTFLVCLFLTILFKLGMAIAMIILGFVILMPIFVVPLVPEIIIFVIYFKFVKKLRARRKNYLES